jgi:hypothetical protein
MLQQIQVMHAQFLFSAVVKENGDAGDRTTSFVVKQLAIGPAGRSPAEFR